MEFQRFSLQNCAEASGVVVVIDVIRAFTTAAYALAAGAERILLVGAVEEALALREAIPGAIVMGEVGGLQVPEFDLGNSPGALAALDLSGRTLIQRTSAGTQGVVRSTGASELFACSLVCASATARAIQRLAPERVSFVVTGIWADGERENNGDEDAACADYVESLLRGEPLPQEAAIRRVLCSRAAQKFLDPAIPEFPTEDLDYCIAVDRFDFAMHVAREEGRFVLRPVR